jgi:hypothetical protein
VRAIGNPNSLLCGPFRFAGRDWGTSAFDVLKAFVEAQCSIGRARRSRSYFAGTPIAASVFA